MSEIPTTPQFKEFSILYFLQVGKTETKILHVKDFRNACHLGLASLLILWKHSAHTLANQTSHTNMLFCWLLNTKPHLTII